MFVGWFGNIGCVFVLMLLVVVFEQVSVGEKLLCASYGDGAYVMLFEMMDVIDKFELCCGVLGYFEWRI